MPNVFQRIGAWAASIVSPAAALDQLVESLPAEDPPAEVAASFRPVGTLRTVDPESMPRDVLASIQPRRGGRSGALAPWPSIDRYPIIAGQALSLQAWANASRLALTGYRQRYVDILDELLEREPHGYGVIFQRITTVSGARIEVKPPVDPEHDRYEEAKEVAEFVECQLRAIPQFRQQLRSLLWGLYYGVAASEIFWKRVDSEWHVERLGWLHSRRLGYPDGDAWELHIWDQGSVGPGDFGIYPTSRLFGIKLSDYPGKFVVHTPQIRGDYPTREGLGRQIGDWMVLKRLGARAAAQYLERFAKPWAIGTFNRAIGGKDQPEADDDDLKALDAALAVAGVGALSHARLPSNVSIDLKTPDGGATAKISYSEWLAYCDAQMSKAVLGQTYTTEPGQYGAKGTADVGKKGAMQIGRDDAAELAESLRRDLVTAIVRLNRPDSLDLVPIIELHVEDEPSPEAVMELAVKGASIGMDLDEADLARRTGLTLANRDEDDEDEPRNRLVPVKPGALMDPRFEQAEPEPDGDEAPADAATPAPEGPDGTEPGDEEPDETGAPPSGKQPAAGKKLRDEIPFMQRHAAFLADVKELKDLGAVVDDDTLAELAELHEVPAPQLASVRQH